MIEEKAKQSADLKTVIKTEADSIKLPKDLYIPPDALRVFLEAFEGPLDLLLYLIKKQNFDICNIPIAEITRQYMKYIGLMQELKLELAAEYLVMAAMLAEIKSRMLLPRPKEESAVEEDPRAELVRRLEEYERFKKAALDINELPRVYREIFPVSVANVVAKEPSRLPQVNLEDLLGALSRVLKRVSLNVSHQIAVETLSIRERMTQVLDRLMNVKFVKFHTLFNYKEGRMGIVVTFVAILELLRQSVIDLVESDSEPDSFYIKKVVAENDD